ncbi:hypothetical protein K458DRAFT_413803 [Lentithecium fluviatile CBS 122367]|uniref:Uncharacterized protein n=1 Tax=Lentithecium fluviatile CBS 122367 TaxID=1168545 RepID=A0A6G1JH72_9PLEO|nr:hypothetical protein K458DRAFT_413803 [Lentithecium fluviatile CBS 122367]
MDKRHTSLSSRRGNSPRPRNHRKRSNSLPIVEALGCSTSEAELILREGRAAVRSRQARRGGRGVRDVEAFRPRNHLKYLHGRSEAPVDNSEGSLSTSHSRRSGHSRFPSDATDRSTSTIIAPNQPPVDEPRTTANPVGWPLGDYSANLAKFIQSQLNSIPSYNPANPAISPCSCPDLSFSSRTPPQSPTKWTRRPSDAPQSIEIPPIRPPLQSTFSAWSSTDDDTDDEVPPLPDADKLSMVDSHTPSVLGYYESSSSFLFSSTPLEEDDGPDTAKGTSFPNQSELPLLSSEQQPPSDRGDYPSSALSSHPQLSSSSAPSISSTSTASYFECKRPISLAPQLRDRIIAAITPPPMHRKVIPAISPFEGQALANLHDITVDENLRRVLVDGMSFDMVRDFAMPDEGLRRVPTPC